MKARKSTKSNIIFKILTYIILLFVIVGVVGFLAFFTNNFTSDFTSFYVQYDNKSIVQKDEVFAKLGQSLQFNCKYVFSNASNSKETGFTVKVLPAPDSDFDFYLDNERRSYVSEKDLTAGFDITINDSNFVILCNRSTKEILQRVYENHVVIVPDGVANDFLIVVTSYDKKSFVSIRLNYVIEVTGVELEKEEINLWL